jgi:hypothetical protein
MRARRRKGRRLSASQRGRSLRSQFCENDANVACGSIVTLADLREDADPRGISVSARQDAVLEDGRRLLLLDDRGWSSTLGGVGADEADIWALTSQHEIAATTRVVVGPDEPFGGRSQADMETDHWNALAEKLRAQGVTIDGSELRRLPHDVVLSARLLARLGAVGR